MLFVLDTELSIGTVVIIGTSVGESVGNNVGAAVGSGISFDTIVGSGVAVTAADSDVELTAAVSSAEGNATTAIPAKADNMLTIQPTMVNGNI